MTGAGGGSNAGLVALFAIVPLVVLMLTSFVKISVVLSLVRNAIGAPDAPSGLIVMGLSLVLTFFVMAPVAVEMTRAAATDPSPSPSPSPSPTPTTTPTPTPTPTPTATPTTVVGPEAGSAATLPELDLEGALRQLVPADRQPELDRAARALVPLEAFLTRHAGAKDRATFVELAQRMGHRANGTELWVLAPAFLTTELREAFAIAVLIFIPFLVIDLLVGLGLASLGLSSTSPQTVALPLKLLLFVAVDGWRLLIDSLLRGYV